MKPNVLVVTRNLPPLVGGMERLIWHVIDELRQDYHVKVIGPSGCRGSLGMDVEVVELFLRPLGLFLLQAKFVALWMSFRCRPKVIIAGSGLMAPFVWLAARIMGARCVVYLHGLDIQANHILYRIFWVPFFRHFDSVLVNSQFTRKLALAANVLPVRITVLHPGVELPETDGIEESYLDFRNRHSLANLPIMLYVGRITPRKGLLYFVDKVLPLVLLKAPEAVLIVIGDAPTNALCSSKNENAKVRLILQEKGLEQRVRFLGSCSDEELGKAYFSANVLVFPVQENANDIEGFGMVALEAAAHGLPTVAFAVGGVPDAVADGCSGKLVTAGEKNDFADAVLEFLNQKVLLSRRRACLNFAKSLQWSSFGEKLRKICYILITNNRDNASL